MKRNNFVRLFGGAILATIALMAQPIVGGKACAMHSCPSLIESKNYDKKSLIEQLPQKFHEFFTSLNGLSYVDDNLGNIGADTWMNTWNNAYNTASNAVGVNIWEIAYNIASEAAGAKYFKVTWADNFANAFVKVWQPGGEAYEVAKDNDIEYFVSLIHVLDEQTSKLKNFV